MANFPAGSIATVIYTHGVEAGEGPREAYLENEPNGAGAYTAVDTSGAPQRVGYNALPVYQSTAGFDWFEKAHVLPRTLNFGNILTDQTQQIEVFSAFRNLEISWTGFTNNAGSGVSLDNEPALPASLDPFQGYVFDLEVLTIGPSSVETTLDFTFSSGVVEVPITIERIVLFPEPPLLPYRETISFLTDIMGSEDGTEQRHALRKNPRAGYEWSFFFDDGAQRSRVENILFEWQRRTFGVPVWHEATSLKVATSASATTFNVAATDYADFRVDGLVLVYQDAKTFDVLTVSAIGATTITVTGGAQNAYNLRACVIPLRTGVIDGNVSGGRYITGAEDLSLAFRILDNDVDLADISGWSTFNGKVLLDDCNVLVGTMPERYDQESALLDNQTGATYQDPTWRSNKRRSQKIFRTSGKQGLWKVRQLLHSLRGPQTSFYLPTFSDDFVLTTGLVNGTSTMAVENFRYAEFVQSRQPRNVIRVLLNDGSTILKTITDATTVDVNNETITLDSAWGDDYDVSDIAMISLVEEVRLASDDIVVEHLTGGLIKRVIAPVVGVFE